MLKSAGKKLEEVRPVFDGEIFTNKFTRLQYATDASAYREIPAAVVLPKNTDDIKKIIRFAATHNVPLIARGAGTSLAGQVVGKGIVVDVSKYLNRIIEINTTERWVKVQPGVVLDELNMALQPYGLFFGPETSTSNRCVIGGMVGNNSCGSHSIIYGSTRDHVLEIKAILSDGSEVIFGNLTSEEFKEKCSGNSLENRLYQHIRDVFSEAPNRNTIRDGYPNPKIKRRNTGYALDLLMDSQPFTESELPFNFCKILAGSEGTLAFSTEIKLNLVPLPPPVKALVCAHFQTREDAFKANLIALNYKPGAVEMMDNNILELTKGNIEQNKNRFFIEGDPAAILLIEFARNSREEIEQVAQKMIKDMNAQGLGYHYPIIFGEDIQKVWNLRKAGLGLLSNMKGDAKPVSLIEDTAVAVEELPAYLNDFEQILKKYNKSCVYYAHIGSGELHLRPILNLKNKADVDLFYRIGLDVAYLVRKYKGSLSGEHGDGRLRGEFIPIVLGEKNYRLLKSVKAAWDPQNIFNPGKITDTPSMKENLRYDVAMQPRLIDTVFDFSSTEGIVRAAEKCNGSGDCLKSSLIGGTMCPSYQATKNEKDSTRARANILREFLTHSNKANPFDHKEIYQVLDLCLSCKACKSECPSSVDMAKLKAEFLQNYYDANGIPLRTRMIAYISMINKFGSIIPSLFNFFVTQRSLSTIIKKSLGFASQRSIPTLKKHTFYRWLTSNLNQLNATVDSGKEVVLFIDEFTNYNDVEIGIKACRLLSALGYKIHILKNEESGRTYLSKGLLKKAKKIANKNIQLYKEHVNKDKPLIGIEPSAIYCFRDEYPDLAEGENQFFVDALAENTYTIEEFLYKEIEAGVIQPSKFTQKKQQIILHGHCQQKAIASTRPTREILSLPMNYEVKEIPSGCCGMAGSFGYEKEHYDLSMKIGELVLFPEIRKSNTEVIIAAPGTSCRHQIKDGVQRKAYHPVEILFDAML